MSRKSTLALTAIAALGLATFAPDAGSARGIGGSLGGRGIASTFGGGNFVGAFQNGVHVGNNAASNAGRSIVRLASQNSLSNFVGSRAKIRCHTVQVGDPRANPPMLVCP